MIKTLGKLKTAPPTGELAGTGLTHFTIEHEATYLPGAPTETLNVLVLEHESAPRVVITNSPLDPGSLQGRSAADVFEAAEQALEVTGIALGRPMSLTPVTIPKPWGQEVWFTGIEARGVSKAGNMPIAWLTDVFSDALGCGGTPLLLKILDPHPVPDLGDLYFEMHREKIEVYVVTNVDTTAWPNGRGAIRYGFNPRLMSAAESRESFLEDYIAAVKAYEIVRREIDSHLDKIRKAKDLDHEAPLKPAEYQACLDEIPQELLAEEQRRRETMYGFTDLRELAVGDVVTVENFVPHSLQHGVRVVEFQTPHYERYILSFGQQVLTQPHWDTEAALDHAITEYRPMAKPEALDPGADLITNFDAFHVLRIRLNPGDSRDITCDTYQLAMGIEGEVTVAGESMTPESALFLPGGKFAFRNDTGQPASFLLAKEGRHIA